MLNAEKSVFKSSVDIYINVGKDTFSLVLIKWINCSLVNKSISIRTFALGLCLTLGKISL